jgi:uncharacterized membrane protein
MTPTTAAAAAAHLTAPRAEPASSRVSRRLWFLVLVLAALGVVAGIARGIYVDSLIASSEPFRNGLFSFFGLTDPFAAGRRELVEQVDGKYRDHAVLTRLHVFAGALFLAGVPFQLSRRFRTRHPRIHRLTGRTLVVMGIVSAVPGLYFGVGVPLAGAGEAVIVAVVGALFIVALLNGLAAARRQDYTTHREWMIRAAAAAIAISTVRLYALVLDLVLTPRGFNAQQIFVICVWLGWVTTIGAAELWIRTRFRLSDA